MWPDWVSNPGPLTLETDTLPTALHVPAYVTYFDNGQTIFITFFNFMNSFLSPWEKNHLAADLG